jgi:hypothetical protein
MKGTIEELLNTLNLVPIRREKDTILLQLANLKLVEIQILGLNGYSVREITRGQNGQHESSMEIENLTGYLKLLENLSWRLQSDPDRICKVWHIDDVFSLDKGLNQVQARSFLQLVAQTQNAEVGINWELLSIAADIVLESEKVSLSAPSSRF